MSNISKQAIQNDLQTATVQEFAKSKGIVQIADVVRTNVNGYPFVTFINSNNEAENVYFSSKLAEKYTEGTPVAKGFFDDLQIAYTKNAQGEERIKLCSKGGNRLELEDLF